MNAERTARIFTWWMKANRKVAFYEEESRQKQKAIDPWNVKHINHQDNVGSEDWCKWNQWSMRSEILRAKLENRPANHWYNCAISNDECERRNALARERFDAKQLKASNLLRLQIQEQQTTVVPGNCVTAEHRRVIEMLLNVCATAFELADDSCQQDVDGEDCHVVPNDAFQKLSDALDEIENTLPTEDIDRSDVFLAWSAMPRVALKSLIQAGNYPAITEEDVALQNYRAAMEGIGHIRRTLEETFGGLHGAHVEPDVLMNCKSICDAIYAAYRSNSPVIPDRWIPVSERLPEIRKGWLDIPVIIAVLGEKDGAEAMYFSDGKFRWGRDEPPIEDVTHWMPLPLAPQEVKNA